MLNEIKIATRKSKLALWQAETVQTLLQNNHLSVQLFPLVTTGDKLQKTQLSNVQLTAVQEPHLATGKGLFIKEIQEALLTNKAHIAVHSMKDLPVTQTHTLSVVSVLPRAGKHDVLILSPKVMAELSEIDKDFSPNKITDFQDFKQLLLQSKAFTTQPIGTTSGRRQMLLKKQISPELNLKILRGNVDTRLQRLHANEFSAILLAEAGLQRLKLFSEENMIILPISKFIPAPAQGIVAIELKATNTELITEIKKINDLSAFIQAGLERLVLFLLGGDCHSAVGVCLENESLFIICERSGVIRETVVQLSPDIFNMLETFSLEAAYQYSIFFEKLCVSSIAEKIKEQLLAASFQDVAEF